MKRAALRTLILAAICLATLGAGRCGSGDDLRRGASMAASVSAEAVREIRAMRTDGDLTVEEADFYAPIFEEAESFARTLKLSLVNYDSLSPKAKRELLVQHLGLLERSYNRLEAQGLIQPKSEEARRKIADWRRRFRRGLALMRVAESALPEAEPTPTPTPTT